MRQNLSCRSILISFVVLLIIVVLWFFSGMGIHMDCGWSGEAFVWNDTDKDGLRDDGEKPLAGVRLFIGTEKGRWPEFSVSDGLGQAYLWTPRSCDSHTVLYLYVEALGSYCRTTPERLSDPPYNFGLAVCGRPT